MRFSVDWMLNDDEATLLFHVSDVTASVRSARSYLCRSRHARLPQNSNAWGSEVRNARPMPIERGFDKVTSSKSRLMVEMHIMIQCCIKQLRSRADVDDQVMSTSLGSHARIV